MLASIFDVTLTQLPIGYCREAHNFSAVIEHDFQLRVDFRGILRFTLFDRDCLLLPLFWPCECISTHAGLLYHIHMYLRMRKRCYAFSFTHKQRSTSMGHISDINLKIPLDKHCPGV
jgi:hypothetical protein